MYEFVLALHSIVRWLVLLAAVVAVAQGFVGWFGRREWSGASQRTSLAFVISLDIQVLMGLLLFVALSPITAEVLRDFESANSDPQLRYWGFEHSFGFFIAFLLAHVGYVAARRASSSVAKFRWAAIAFLLSTLVIIVSMPWPGQANGRPLLPFG